jgi:hypothetical protein
MTDTNAIIERLFAAAVVADRHLRTRDELAAWLDEPDSRYPVSRCHDWRNHVPAAVWDEWEGLPLVAKLVAFLPAAAAAHSEEWD